MGTYNILNLCYFVYQYSAVCMMSVYMYILRPDVALVPPGIELETVVSLHVGAGNRTQVFSY